MMNTLDLHWTAPSGTIIKQQDRIDRNPYLLKALNVDKTFDYVGELDDICRLGSSIRTKILGGPLLAGSGKSYTALWIGEYLNLMHKILFSINDSVFFNIVDIQDNLERLEEEGKGFSTYILLDEDDTDYYGEGSSTFNQYETRLETATRQRQIIFTFCSNKDTTRSSNYILECWDYHYKNPELYNRLSNELKEEDLEHILPEKYFQNLITSYWYGRDMLTYNISSFSKELSEKYSSDELLDKIEYTYNAISRINRLLYKDPEHIGEPLGYLALPGPSINTILKYELKKGIHVANVIRGKSNTIAKKIKKCGEKLSLDPEYISAKNDTIRSSIAELTFPDLGSKGNIKKMIKWANFFIKKREDENLI